VRVIVPVALWNHFKPQTIVMKKLLIAGLLLLASHITFAQEIVADAGKPTETKMVSTGNTTTTPAVKTVFITPANQWQHIEMKVNADQVYFTNLDGLGSLKVHVTNSDGVETMKIAVNSETNAINCKKLKSGLYFLTLVNENTDEKKAFMLTRP
jgi:hypothetical protein